MKIWDISESYTDRLAEQFIYLGDELFTLTGHEAAVMDVDFSPDGKLLEYPLIEAPISDIFLPPTWACRACQLGTATASR